MNSHLDPDHDRETCWCRPQVIVKNGQPVGPVLNPRDSERLSAAGYTGPITVSPDLPREEITGL